MKSPLKSSLISLAVFSATSNAMAGNEDIPLYYGDEIVVTAARVPQSINSTLGDVSIITREDIARSGQSTLAELLQAQPGIEISANGGMGATSNVYIRGASSNHTLILVDGIRISSATFGTTALQHIPLGQIERIEILRQPASSLYGSDAVGGVIQIFTKTGAGKPRANLSLGVGGYDTQMVGAGYGGQVNDTSFSFQLGHTSSGGFSATNPRALYGNYNSDKDPYRNNNFSAKVEHVIKDGQEVGFASFLSDSRVHYDAGPARDDYNDQSLRAFSIYSRNQITTDWHSTLRYGLGTDDMTSHSANPGVFKTDQNQFAWQNDILVRYGTLMLSLERLEQKVTSSTAYSQTKRVVDSALAGYQGSVGNHLLQLNARHDENSQFGKQDTGTILYGYRLTPALRLTLGGGSAFKAPTFNDLYYPLYVGQFGYTYQGNPNLKPEKALSKEVGLVYQVGASQFSAKRFSTHVSNLILSSNGTLTDFPTNIGSASIDGLELGGRATLGAYQLKASVTFQSATNDADSTRLPYRANRHASLGVDRSFGAWTLGGDMVVSGDRYDNPANTRKLGGYVVANMFAAYKLNKETILRGRVNNLFDRDYEPAWGFNSPRANLFVSLEYQQR